MKNLLHKETTNEIIERINRVTADTKPLWGKMNAAQMMAHCQAPIKVSFGEAKRSGRLMGILFGPWIKKVVLSEKPFKHGLPTHKSFLVTQGTVEKDVSKIIEPTLEAFKGTDYLVVATTGGSKTNELKQKYPQENFIIEDFIPFDDVMPYADVYITNGGYGGVMMGIENELPLVVAGVHEGKNEINARVGYFNLGINLKTERPTPLQLKKAVGEIFRNGVYKQNVSELAEEFNRYLPHQLAAGYVADLLRKKTNIVFRTERVEERVY